MKRMEPFTISIRSLNRGRTEELKESVKTRKKLIEVALPLEAINLASAREKSIRHGHPSTLHQWWARRPLAAARAIIFAQMVDDPSSHPELFVTEKAQERERRRLFQIIEDLVVWENTTNEEVLDRARAEIWQSWRSTCADNADHPRARELFDRQKLPAFHDPFAGGGAIPLEAQRLGLDSFASDLNPVAVLINKSMIEIPPKFNGREPVNPEWHKITNQEKAMRGWQGAQGLAEDVRYYGSRMREEAQKRIGYLYPPAEVTEEMAEHRADLRQYRGRKLPVIAWLWARTVKSPNPAFSQIEVPLSSTFMLSTKAGKEVYVEPQIEEGGYRFTVRVGPPRNPDSVKNGTKLSRGANFRCLMSSSPISPKYIYQQANAGLMGTRLMAVVVEGDGKRLYLEPSNEMEAVAAQAKPEWFPDLEMPKNPRWFSPPLYGLKRFGDLFTPRQLVALTTFSDVIAEIRKEVLKDAETCLSGGQGKSLEQGGTGASAYADAIVTYLSFAISKVANIGSSVASWMSDRGAFRETFARQAIPMVWDFAEANSFADAGGSLSTALDKVRMALDYLPSAGTGHVFQADASTQSVTEGKVISCDPPYYDNIGYADLSDFFYVWLRRSLRSIFPELLATVAVPKAEELVATPYRHGGKKAAEVFFLRGMTGAMEQLSKLAHTAYPVTIYYAFKQTESEGIETASTGWETFLGAVIKAGFELTGTWPMRTEGAGRIVAKDTNALASSIILVCRRRSAEAQTATRRDFLNSLKAELPLALKNLQKGNIAPVDLAQAAIGPGMAVYTRYAQVIDADGKSMTVRQALALINDVLDEVLAEQEGDFDADTRWALTWFDQFGFSEGDYGIAELLANARNTSVEGMRTAGILTSKSGKVRLLRPEELPDNWDPIADKRLTAWEVVHHLVRTLASGEATAAALIEKLGATAETGRELAYRLYNICERRKRTQDALAYNGLVQSWPEILTLARQVAASDPTNTQSVLFTETA
jgi:putative DNA methylase